MKNPDVLPYTNVLLWRLITSMVTESAGGDIEKWITMNGRNQFQDIKVNVLCMSVNACIA